jgi:hypothetical protein
MVKHRIFCDYHHGGLYHSLHLLFEKRLGWELYRPIGLDWFHQEYWKIAEPYKNDMGTICQYLDINSRGWNTFENLNGDYTLSDGIYYIYDHAEGYHQKAITLEKFKELNIDIVISSIPAHDTTFQKLIKDYKSNATHISQIGNIYQFSNLSNVLCSTLPTNTVLGQNIVFYHQEFDLDIFSFIPPMNFNRITSFVHLLPMRSLFGQYSNVLQEFEFRAYGSGCPDGNVMGTKNIAKIMQQSTFGINLKPEGDGFGHIIWNWAFCGRPLIICGSHYRDKSAGVFLKDGITCIDIEGLSIADGSSKIRYYSEPERYRLMCHNIYNLAKENCDFDKEETEIRKFLSKAIRIKKF